MNTTFVLYHFYQIEEMKPEWMKLISTQYNGCEQVAIPTEMVITEAMVVHPKYGRVYGTSLYLKDGNIYSCQELQKLEKNFKGTSYENEVMLYEVWSNHGDDGHTNYEFDGYIFMDEATYKEKIKKFDYRDQIEAHWDMLNELDYENRYQQ